MGGASRGGGTAGAWTELFAVGAGSPIVEADCLFHSLRRHTCLPISTEAYSRRHLHKSRRLAPRHRRLQNTTRQSARSPVLGHAPSRPLRQHASPSLNPATAPPSAPTQSNGVSEERERSRALMAAWARMARRSRLALASHDARSASARQSARVSSRDECIHGGVHSRRAFRR